VTLSKHVHFSVQICELHRERAETAHFSISHLIITLFSHDFPKLTLFPFLDIQTSRNKFLVKKFVQITEVRVHKNSNLARKMTLCKTWLCHQFTQSNYYYYNLAFYLKAFKFMCSSLHSISLSLSLWTDPSLYSTHDCQWSFKYLSTIRRNCWGRIHSKFLMKAINSTPTPHTQTARASMHNPLLLYKPVANRLNNAHENPVTIKNDVQSRMVQATQPCQSIQRRIYPTYEMFTGFISKSSSSYTVSSHGKTVLANTYIFLQNFPT